MHEKQKLIQSHLARPAILVDGKVHAGWAGQTHSDLAKGDNPIDGGVDESQRGFVTHHGDYLSRSEARDLLNIKGLSLGEGEPDSKDLFPIEPIYKGSSGQEIYQFPNGLAASVVNSLDNPHLKELAVIRLFNPNDLSQGFAINYRSPFGAPKSNLSEVETRHHLEDLYHFTDQEIKDE